MQQQGNFLLFERDEFRVWLLNQVVTRNIKIIQNHHTWLPNYSNFKKNNHFQMLEGMRNSHLGRGFIDIAQQLTTFPDGKVAYSLGRPFDKVPSGIKGVNANGICIEHVGCFDINGDKMTDEHRQTILFVNAVLCEKFQLPVTTNHVVYHNWYDLRTGERKNGLGTTKSCPGTNFFGGNSVASAQKNFIPFVESMRQKLFTKSEPVKVIKVDPPKVIEKEGNCKVDELKQWQKDMGEKAIESLFAADLMENPEDWKKKLGEHVPNWLFFEMMKRIADKNKE